MLLHYKLECSQPGEVRLVQGQRINGQEGMVEICIAGEWTRVCSSSWDYRDAQVVCRQLGFGTSGMQLLHALRKYLHFGLTGALASFVSSSGKVYVNNVACQGSESTLLNCSQDFLGEVMSCGNCASVMCPTSKKN